MTNDCTVCGLEGTPRYDVDGRFRGNACSVECAAMLFFRWGDSLEARRYESWEWRRRRADVRGEEFTEPSPMDATDRAFAMWESQTGVKS